MGERKNNKVTNMREDKKICTRKVILVLALNYACKINKVNPEY